MANVSRYAFLIGIQNYQFVSRLKNPVSDIGAIGKLLAENFNYQVFTSEDEDLKTATLHELFAIKLLEKLRNIPENSQVLIYFAGHGYAQDTEQGMKGYLIPKDGKSGDSKTWYSMDAMMNEIEKLTTRHLLLVLDCCFGGTFRFSSNHRAIRPSGTGEKLFKQHFEFYTKRPSWQVLTSTAPNQEAIDFFTHNTIENHSPFAHLFLKGLSQNADINSDKIVTLGELFVYLQRRLAIISERLGNLQNVGVFPFPSEKHQNGEYIFLLDEEAGAALPLRSYLNPYKGLKSYEKEDAALFFGRNKAVKQLMAKVQKVPITIVIGASGSGKSSLVKAGIVPKLIRAGQLLEICQPGRTPADLLNGLGDFDILVVDQLEQIITQSEDTQKAGFWEHILRYLSQGKKIIVTVRIDFEKQLKLPETLQENWEKGRIVVPPFTSEELREIIITPALRVGRFIEPISLVDTIVNEVIVYPGSLPLLSFTMQELFEMCKNDPYRSIGEADYKALNGVTGALQKSADKVYDSFGKQEQLTMRTLMLRMVSLSGGETAGKKILKTELDFGKVAENNRIIKVINKLLAERLIQSGETPDKESYIEPSHDALVREWGKMQEWIKTFTEDNILLQTRLDSAITNYIKEEKKRKRLWYDNPDRVKVFQAQKKQTSIPLRLNKFEQEFISRSGRLRRNIIASIATVVLGFMVIILGFAIVANNNAEQANENLITAYQKEREVHNQRLKPLFDNVEIFNKANEYKMALRICDTIELRMNSIDTLNQDLKKLDPDLIDSVNQIFNRVSLDKIIQITRDSIKIDSLRKLNH